MPVELIGIACTADRSETIAQTDPAVQPDYLYHLTSTHEQSGSDRVLVTRGSSSPDPFTVADQVLNVTARLGVLLARRPGLLAPTIAARKLATIDAFYPGRVAWHVVTAGAAGHSTALVGSYEQVAESLLDYVAVGASTLLIWGCDPLPDAAAYADLIRLVHDQVGDDVAGYRARAAA
jgi:alkanesulfonate monooxygenase SsuD/methylene tetrahydromethanopterin reductase-like flavin-dependent oxidoreductase (luciferase family)